LPFNIAKAKSTHSKNNIGSRVDKQIQLTLFLNSYIMFVLLTHTIVVFELNLGG